MAWNFSQGSSFSAPQEKNSCASMGSVFDGYLIKNCGCFGNSLGLCSFNGNLEGNPCFEMIKAVIGDCDDPENVVVEDDVLDRLPMDPFGMNIESTFTSISDWFEHFEWGFQPEYGVCGVDETHEKINDHLHFLGLSWGWNGTESLQPQWGSAMGNGISIPADVYNGYQNSAGLYEYDGGVVTEGNAGLFLNVSHRYNWISSSDVEESQNCTKIDFDDQGGAPHDALYFVLGYLSVRDLLLVEQVCRSFRDAVRGDPLLWRTVRIDQTLNDKITNDTLVRVTSRAQGTLQCLILLNCFWLTDIGLGFVLQSNPRVVKLVVLDCCRLTIEGILFNLRARKSAGTPGIKHLRIGGRGGVCDVTHQQFEELKELLDVRKHVQPRDPKPQFYRAGYSHIICEDGRAIDIELCPRCQKPRPVYDCPAESCQQKHRAALLCRGCTMCIQRCIHCGRCLKDFDYIETFSFDSLCLNCRNHPPHCPENEAVRRIIISSENHGSALSLWLMEYP